MPSMTDSQVERLYDILETEKKKLEELEIKYQKEIKGLNEKHLKEWQDFQMKKFLDDNISLEISEIVTIIENITKIDELIKIKVKIDILKDKDMKKNNYYYLQYKFAYKLKEWEKSLEYLNKSYELNSLDNSITDKEFYVLGNKLSKQKKYKKAIEGYKKSIEINPKDDKAYFNMGNAYGNKKEYDKAIEAYKESIKINSKKDEAYFNMGYYYTMKKEFDMAIEAHKKSIEINPKKDGAYISIFEIQLIQNQIWNRELESRYIKLFANQKNSFIYYYEMLKILENIVNNIEVDIKIWKQKYKDVSLDWGWNEIDTWIETIKDKSKKKRLLEAVEVFKKH